jgi:AraC-like DNA-binding protein
MKVRNAAGGTNRAGVPAEAFAMPMGTRMRYDVPAPALASCVTGYAIYACDSRAAIRHWYLPAPPMIVILLDAGPVSVRMRNREVVVDRASVWGATSHAYEITAHGGISVGIGLTGEGWARFAGRSARGARDSVLPLTQFVPADTVAQLVAALDALDDDAGIAPVLDAALPALFGPPLRAAGQLQALDRLIATDGMIGVDQVARTLNLEPHSLRRLATDHHGMPVKSLLVRARFVRSFARWLSLGEPAFYAGIDSSYHDVSHFLHDAASYLGTTPRRFARREITFMRASLRARHAVLGSPTPIVPGVDG